MAPQIVRITLVFGVFLLLFLIVKALIAPDGFDEAGFHRRKGPDLVASALVRHGGMTACAACHADKVEATPHVQKKVHCESCHRAAGGHADEPDKFKPFVPSERADCTRCHAKIVSRPAWYPQIDPKTHNPDTKCVSCHEIHPAPAESGAQTGKGGQP